MKSWHDKTLQYHATDDLVFDERGEPHATRIALDALTNNNDGWIIFDKCLQGIGLSPTQRSLLTEAAAVIWVQTGKLPERGAPEHGPERFSE